MPYKAVRCSGNRIVDGEGVDTGLVAALPAGSSPTLIDAWRPYIAEVETTTDASLGWTAFTMLRSTRH